MAATRMSPRVVDNDRDEITVTLDGREIRGWSYESEAERRTKMLAAREFCEGWHEALEHIASFTCAVMPASAALPPVHVDPRDLNRLKDDNPIPFVFDGEDRSGEAA